MRAFSLTATFAPRGNALTPAQLRDRLAPGPLAWREPRLEPVDIPEPSPGHGQVIVEVGVCGICGSDTHCVETDAAGYARFSGPMRLPCVMGHEIAGRVVAVGPGVQRAEVGQLVCAEGMLSCGLCEACKRGMPNQCPSLDMLGFSADGGFAERLAIHERHLWPLTELAEALGSENKAMEWGSMVEPIACAFNGIWASAGGMKPGSHVAVYGCGPIGLGAVALCRAAGAARIIAFDTRPERVELAKACGADDAFDVKQLKAQGGCEGDVVKAATGGWGADLSIEAAGDGQHTLPQILASLAPQATVLYLGRTGEHIPLGMDALVSGAVRVIGSRGHAGGGCYPNLLRMMTQGGLNPSAMITARMPHDQAAQALERSKARTDGKILLTRS